MKNKLWIENYPDAFTAFVRKLPSFLILILLSLDGIPQQLTLEECYQRLDSLFPLVEDKSVYQQQFELTRKKINTSWLPQMTMNAQATYQSDVTKLNFDFPPQFNMEIDDPAKDQYKVSIEILQPLFDGGISSIGKEIEFVNSEIHIISTEVELYAIKPRLNDIYFGILKLKKTKEILELTRIQMLELQKVISSGINNGVLTESAADELNAELLRTSQQISEVACRISGFSGMLGKLLDIDISTETEFVLPEVSEVVGDISRPEYQLFELNRNKIDVSSEFLKKTRYPRLYAFAQMGYGKPGLNMLSNEFDYYYYVGARFTWNIWDWKRTNYDRQVLEAGKFLIDTKTESFTRNIESSLEIEQANIERLKEAMEDDLEIIRLREKITKNSESRLQNGIISATDYLEDLNRESLARINFEIHKTELIQSQYNYIIIKGL
ncbi:MAG: TolC family protein [Bacteroidota bacterium]